MINYYTVYYIATIFSTAITTLGVSLGQAKAGQAALEAINIQPKARGEIARTMTLSLVLIETAGLLGFVMSFLMLLKTPTTMWSAYAAIGISLALAIPGLVLGFASALPAKAALLSIARQPFSAKPIANFMLLTQSVIQTALAFGFIISLIISTQLNAVTTLTQAAAFIASGLCIGIGSIGPVMGVGIFTKSACESLGLNKNAYNSLLSFTIISQAIIETPVIFAAIISFWLIRAASLPVEADHTIYVSLIFIAAAFVMAIGTLAPGLSSGFTASKACKKLVLQPELFTVLSRTSMISQGLIDTAAIYAFLVASLLLVLPFR